MKRLLLISSSLVHGGGYLDHAESEIRDLLDGVRQVLFIPWALHDWDAYAAKARVRFETMGFNLRSIHEEADPIAALRHAEAVFIGGGNTFRLLAKLQEMGAVEVIRAAVLAGMPYVGSSAGSNVACPTIRTTKDMPIVQPRSFDALSLVPFQISPHYLDPDPSSTHMGETQEERILTFHEEASTPVAGLREGAVLCVADDAFVLKGRSGVRIFRQGERPVERTPVTNVEDLLIP